MASPEMSGYVTLEQAVDTIGHHLMPGEWLGQETRLLKLDSRATEDAEAEKSTATDTTLGRLNRAVNYLLRALFRGDVKAVATREDGGCYDFPAAFWMRPGIRAVFRSGELPVNFRVAIGGHRADAGKWWVLVSESDLHRLRSELAAGAGVTDIESELRAWLAAKVRALAQGQPIRRKQVWAEAQRRFGSRLPYRSFERIWTAAVPEEWGQAARAGSVKSPE